MNSQIKKAKPEKDGEFLNIQLLPDLEPRLGKIYSNYISISHSPFDFTLRFCDAPSGGDIVRLKKGKNIPIEIPNLVDVVISPDMMPNLIEALKENYELYLMNYKKAKCIVDEQAEGD